MRYLVSVALTLFGFILHGQIENEAPVIKQIYTTALVENQGYEWLEKLCSKGSRLAGSKQATQAVLDFQKIADSLGFQTQLQAVTVPHWVRGPKEIAHYEFGNKKYYMRCTALGGSVATPSEGLKAELIEIKSFAQLDSIKDELKGKIAFYNIPMDPAFINTFFAYSNAVKQRYAGALEASKKGAIAVIIRSLSATENIYPHTGSMTYVGAKKKIPAMAISTADATLLSQHLKEDPQLLFEMRMACEWKDSVQSFNLIADLPGKEIPDEIILIGGHIDSWDLGTGAHDDGAGSIHSLEAAWLLQKLDLLPSRTLRVVFFMNEEFGLTGAKEYAKQTQIKQWNHVIAMESDAGGFSPRGISIVAPDSIIDKIKMLRPLLEPYGIHQFSQTGSGADISKIKSDDLVMVGFRPDNHRYFEIHHSALDNISAVNPRELELGSATLASLIYLLDKYNIIAK